MRYKRILDPVGYELWQQREAIKRLSAALIAIEESHAPKLEELRNDIENLKEYDLYYIKDEIQNVRNDLTSYKRDGY